MSPQQGGYAMAAATATDLVNDGGVWEVPRCGTILGRALAEVNVLAIQEIPLIEPT
jgi:hypothetical protein